jgi:hypothetical protein
VIYRVIHRQRISDTETRETSAEGEKVVPHVRNYPGNFKEIESFLNQMSSEGWDLVALVDSESNKYTDYIFKMA